MIDGDGRAIYPGFQFPQQPVVMMPGRQVVITVLVMTLDGDYDYGHDAWTSGHVMVIMVIMLITIMVMIPEHQVMMVIMVMMLIMMPGRHVLMMVLVKMMTLKMRMKNNVVKNHNIIAGPTASP